MANDNRRSLRVKNVESIKLKKKMDTQDASPAKSRRSDASPASKSGPSDASSLRRSSREISSKKQIKENQSNTRKSERLENMKPSGSPIKEKPERTQEQMKKYDRRKKNTLRPLGLDNFVEDPASSSTKSKMGKDGRSPMQSGRDTSEDKNHEKQGVDVGGRKRKRVATGVNKALFKSQDLKTEAGHDDDSESQDESCHANSSSKKDVGKEPKRAVKLHQIDDSKNKNSGSDSVDVEERSDHMGEETMLKASKRQCSTSHSSLGNSDAKDINDHYEVEEACVGSSKNRRRKHGLGKRKEPIYRDKGCNTDICGTPTSKDRTTCEANGLSEIVNGESRMGRSICFACKLDGKLRYCDAVGCNRCYHPSCLDPPVSNVSSGIWRCTFCVKNNKSSFPSRSGVTESIWDTREVEVSDAEGLRKEKQYFVKYKGLAHIHNQWVTETKLLCEAPSLVDTLSLLPYIESLWLGGSMRWSEEWTVPHQLLKKRLQLIFKPLYRHQEHTGKVLDYHYAWLVKWQGLGDEQATWEPETISVLDSPQGHKLKIEYDERQNTKIEELLVRLPTILNCPPGMDNIHLSYVKKLHDAWNKGQNSIVFDEQEWATRIALFIMSLKDVTLPFLLITTSDSMSRWEAMFLKIAPCNDLKVSLEEAEGQRSLRLLEFIKEVGQLAFQVLLCPVDTFVKDLDVLKAIKWEAVIVDESQSSEISAHFSHIKSLSTDKRLLIVCGQLSMNMSGYLAMLSLFDCDALPNCDVSKTELYDIIKLKETLSAFIAYECKSSPSKFVEFWVPVQISNVQLEQYCSVLLSNAMALSSCSKSDTFGALHDILVSNRKCCDHPYIVDQSLQGSMTKDLEPAKFLDVGIKASGKLQFLDLILPEMRKRQLRVLILFQPLSGSGKDSASIGDILDDFLRQRFGADSYERVDGIGIIPSKKQVALNNFNNKEMGRFVFLLEYRACLPSIKLSSVDTIIIFDSDWNPANDLRALQRVAIDSQSEQIMIFRLYTSWTLEEKILRLAEHNVTIDGKLQNISRNTTDALLIWGATYLFNRLAEFHNAPELNSSSEEECFWNELTEEFLKVISHECQDKDPDKLRITKVQSSSGTYGKNLPSPSELITQLPDGEQPHTFWRNLLVGRNPSWKYISISTPRHRKRPQYLEESHKKTNASNRDVGRKRKKSLNNIVEPLASKSETEGAARVISHEGSQSLPVDIFLGAAICDEASFRHLLKVNISKLCEVLRLSEDVKIMVESFLEYVVDNYRVNKEPASTLQAFLISLCWIGSALLKHKLDRSQSLVLANTHLNFSCKEEEVNSVYLKLEPAKEMFLLHTDNLKKIDISKDLIPTSAQATSTRSLDPMVSDSAPISLRAVKVENLESPHDQYMDDAVIIGSADVDVTKSSEPTEDIQAKKDEGVPTDALKDNIDSGSSNGSTPASAAASKEKVPAVQMLASSASDQPVSTNLEIQKEPLQADEGQGIPSFSAEISSLRIIDGAKVGQVNQKDSSLEPPHEEPHFSLPANPLASEHETHTILQSKVNLENPPVVCEETSLGEQDPDLHSADRVDCQPIVEPPNPFQNPEAQPQVLETTAGVPNHNATPPGANLLNVQGSDSHSQRMPRQIPPSNFNPLASEIEKLRELKDSVIKYHEDIMLKVKSDHEKELEEMIAQINRKYEAIRQDTEAAFQLKKKDIDKNLNRVILNKMLGEAFKSKCQELQSADSLGKQVARSGGTRQPNILSSTVVRSTAATSSSPAQSSRSHPVTKQQQPPLQIVNHSAKLFSTAPSKPSLHIHTRPTLNRGHPITSSRIPSSNAAPSAPWRPLTNTNPITPSTRINRLPPNINPITPFTKPLNNSNPTACSSRYLRAPAPHIRPFQPSTPVSSRVMSSQHTSTSLPRPASTLFNASPRLLLSPPPQTLPVNRHPFQSSPRNASAPSTLVDKFLSPPPASVPPPAPPASVPPEPPLSVSTEPAPVSVPVTPSTSLLPASVPTEPPASVPTEPPASVPTEPPPALVPVTASTPCPPASVPTEPLAQLPTEPPASVPPEPPASVPTEPPPASVPATPSTSSPPASVPTEPPASVPTEPPPASVPMPPQMALYSSLQTGASRSQMSLLPFPSIPISHSGLYSSAGMGESGIQLPGSSILSLSALDMLMDIDKQAGFHLQPNTAPSQPEVVEVSDSGDVSAGDIVCLSDDD